MPSPCNSSFPYVYCFLEFSLRIGYLDILGGEFRSEDDFYYHLFRQAVVDNGHEFNYARVKSLESSMIVCDKVFALIRDSDSFFVTSSSSIMQSPLFHPEIRSRIRNGARIIMCASGTDYDAKLTAVNTFLSHYDMYVPNWSICNYSADKRLIIIDRREYPECFRDSSLFHGVDCVCIDAPGAIQYYGDAQPVLEATACQYVCNNQSASEWKSVPATLMGNETKKKEFIKDYMTCMAVQMCDYRGAFLFLNGDVLADPINTASGRRAGIASNEQFAKNLLGFLSVGHDARMTRCYGPKALVDECERHLRMLVWDKLGKENEEWFTEAFIPKDIYKKCNGRSRGNAGERGLPQAHLDLPHYPAIIRHNWSLFRDVWAERHGISDVEQALIWEAKLNQLRILESHETAKAFAAAITIEDINFLKETEHHLRMLR